jgi:hypothetical protein
MPISVINCHAVLYSLTEQEVRQLIIDRRAAGHEIARAVITATKVLGPHLQTAA